MQVDRNLIIVLALFGALSAFSLLYNAYAMDEYTYLMMARDIAHGNFLSSPEIGRFPAYPFLIGMTFSLFGDSLLAARLVSILAGAALIALVYLAAKEHIGAEAGFWAAALLATSPFFVFLSNKVLTESLFLLLLFACGLAVLKSATDKRFLIVLGALFGLLLLTRYVGIYLAPIALIYWWRKGALDVIKTKEFVLGALAFLVVMSPWFYYSYLLEGDPFATTREFLAANQNLVQGGFTLTDRIPSYLLALPFVAGSAVAVILLAPSGLLAALGELRGRLGQKDLVAFSVLAAVLVGIAMEVYGFQHFRLLRYIVPAAPFVAVIAGACAGALLSGEKTLGGFKLRREHASMLLMALLAANVIASAGIVYWFGSLPRYSAYHAVGQFAASNCQSYYSNVERVVEFYVGQKQSAIAAAQCTILSSYDLRIEGADYTADRTLVFEKNGIKVFKRA